MPEKKLGGLSGTPWHIGYVTKAEDDPRRDKRKCKHYKPSDKRCNLGGPCYGSAHCPKYRCVADERRREKVKKDNVSWQAQSKNIRTTSLVQIQDDVEVFCYNTQKYYMLHINKLPAEQSPLAKLCLGQKNNHQFQYNGYNYKINRILKCKIENL